MPTDFVQIDARACLGGHVVMSPSRLAGPARRRRSAKVRGLELESGRSGAELRPGMWFDIVNAVSGMLVGFLSGFYFERRSSKATRIHNRELEEELAALRTSVYSVGGEAPRRREERELNRDLVEEVAARAQAIQDADGRLSRTRLTSFFFAQGYRADDIERAVQTMCTSGRARERGKWLEVL